MTSTANVICSCARPGYDGWSLLNLQGGPAARLELSAAITMIAANNNPTTTNGHRMVDQGVLKTAAKTNGRMMTRRVSDTTPAARREGLRECRLERVGIRESLRRLMGHLPWLHLRAYAREAEFGTADVPQDLPFGNKTIPVLRARFNIFVALSCELSPEMCP